MMQILTPNACTMIDFITLIITFSSFIIIATISYVNSQSHSNENAEPNQDESAALLEETDQFQSTSNTQIAKATRAFKLFFIKSLVFCILLTFAIDIILELYFDLKRPIIPSEILEISCHQDWYFRVIRLFANVFCWTCTSVYLFFQDQELNLRKWLENYTRRYLEKWFILELLAETVQTTFWTIILFFKKDANSIPFWSLKLDVALYGLMISRVFLLILLVALSIENRRSLTHLLNSGIMELSPLRKTFARIKRLIPFLWPNQFHLQFLVLLCLLLLALGRVVNVLVPVTYKYLVEELAETPSKDPADRAFAWIPILAFTFFRFMQGGVGVLSSLQYFLWIPVGQYTTRQISVKMLAHLHSLPLSFHIHSKTGELLRVMDRGTASIGSLLSYLLFNILPVLIDIILAVIYFSIAFDSLISFIVCVTMICYIIATIAITEWRTKFRRDMNDLDAAARARAVDSLMNYETVKYFGREQWEVDQYEKAIKKYQVSDFKSSASLNLLNTAQNCVITAGLFLGLLVCGSRVSHGDWTVGQFVGFVTYLLQLYQPLNWFGTYYRVIQQNFIDMEKMMEVFEQDGDVDIFIENESAVISSSAPSTESKGIVFDRVWFTYDQVPVLQGISFEIPAGKNFALVGTSGGGKSSILKLLFRFYTVDQGQILLDGVDISTIPLPHLRKKFGVVPQDCILFNDTIRNNIAYGADSQDPEVVSQERIELVAKQAQIHDRIMSFPQGYDTLVGERGVRLSGGEKQRVAFARTLLKNPDIILLDEATSSLDTSTETILAQTMDQVLAGRTRLTIAHRLSTIVGCDCILVVDGGKIAEKGRHAELIRLGGIYYRMWNRQVQEAQEKKKYGATYGSVSVGNGASPRSTNESLRSRHN